MDTFIKKKRTSQTNEQIDSNWKPFVQNCFPLDGGRRALQVTTVKIKKKWSTNGKTNKFWYDFQKYVTMFYKKNYITNFKM